MRSMAGSRPAIAAGGATSRNSSGPNRPQAMRLYRTPPGNGDGRLLVEGRLVERAYLGEHWDYVFSPSDSALRLRVTAAPADIFEADETLWLDIDPRQMAPIS